MKNVGTKAKQSDRHTQVENAVVRQVAMAAQGVPHRMSVQYDMAPVDDTQVIRVVQRTYQGGWPGIAAVGWSVLEGL